MRDDHHRARAVVQHALEPADRVDVEVVGRLVEKQDVRVREQRLREQHAQLPARRDGAHRSFVQRLGDADAEQQLAGARFRRVAVLLGERRFELGGPDVVVLGRVGVRVDGVLVLAHLPHFAMAHQHHVEHAHVLVGELILLELAQPLVRVERDVAARRLEVAAEDLHQRRLAAAVRADQAVTIPVAELDADVLEQGLRPELHGDVGGGQHLEIRSWGSKTRVKQVILLESSTYLKVRVPVSARSNTTAKSPVAPLRSSLPLDVLRRPARAGGGGFACRGARRRRPRPDRPRRSRGTARGAGRRDERRHHAGLRRRAFGDLGGRHDSRRRARHRPAQPDARRRVSRRPAPGARRVPGASPIRWRPPGSRARTQAR